SPRIGDRLLFETTNPVRWIIDRDQTMVSKPSMFVEFVGSDCLAGEVVAFVAASENSYEARPQHIVVNPRAELLPPDVMAPSELRVTLDWIQRIVWEHIGPDELRPGTVWLRSGTSMSFRTLRWASTGIIVLTNEGIKQIPFHEVGEIHLLK